MSDWSLSVRVRSNNPEHHLFNNHGTWWCHFWAIADGIRQKRFRVNLHTRVLSEARSKRNSLLKEGWRKHLDHKVKGNPHA
jgi:hypothetical protein